jgi:secondary thiamine-phosphate synthase enzyme
MTSSTLPVASEARREASRIAEPVAGFRVFSKRLECATIQRFEIVDLTERITEAIRESGIENGVAHVQSLHTTTALFLNECQAALLADIEAVVRLLVEDGKDWRHNDRRYSDCDRGNAAAHLRSLLIGQSISLQVENYQPVLGKWQAMLFLEMDGPQARLISVQVMGM